MSAKAGQYPSTDKGAEPLLSSLLVRFSRFKFLGQTADNGLYVGRLTDKAGPV